MNIIKELIQIYELDLNVLDDKFRKRVVRAAAAETEKLAHSVHHESIRIDQRQRLENNINWEDEYFTVLNLGCDLADRLLGCD